MKNIKKLLGKRIKELRKQKGLSQEQLAESTNIDTRSISHIECGDTFPSKSLLDIANALNIELKDLFDFEHLEVNNENMKKYISDKINYLNSTDLKTIYRLTKAMN